jgi:hypothetical protein
VPCANRADVDDDWKTDDSGRRMELVQHNVIDKGSPHQGSGNMYENAMNVSVSCLLDSSNCEYLVDNLPLVLPFWVLSFWVLPFSVAPDRRS